MADMLAAPSSAAAQGTFDPLLWLSETNIMVITLKEAASLPWGW